MAPIQKTSDQNNMSVFETLMNDHVPLKERTPEMKSNTQTERQKEAQSIDQTKRAEWDNQEAASASNKLVHNNTDEIDLMRGPSSIRSARCAPDGITNDGGSGRFVGSNKNNTFNDALLDIIANSKTSKEITAEEKMTANDMRQQKQDDVKRR